jgi:hypothetical protein
MCRAGKVEQTIGKLKRFKRIAKRCGKTSGSYGATLNLGQIHPLRLAATRLKHELPDHPAFVAFRHPSRWPDNDHCDVRADCCPSSGKPGEAQNQ